MTTAPFPRLQRYSDPLALLCALLIGLLSLTPLPALPELPGGDKLQHFIAYAVLAFLATCARPGTRGLLLALTAVIAYGGIIELLQPYVNRYREMADLLANGAGALLGVAIMLLVRGTACTPRHPG
ncbi:MAG TPA: VanZ family protein [Sedimenticola sp.]|nr:VanZ family protein [Sedimenticola sp.]